MAADKWSRTKSCPISSPHFCGLWRDCGSPPPKNPSSPMVTRCLLSSFFTKEAISSTHAWKMVGHSGTFVTSPQTTAQCSCRMICGSSCIYLKRTSSESSIDCSICWTFRKREPHGWCSCYLPGFAARLVEQAPCQDGRIVPVKAPRTCISAHDEVPCGILVHLTCIPVCEEQCMSRHFVLLRPFVHRLAKPHVLPGGSHGDLCMQLSL